MRTVRLVLTTRAMNNVVKRKKNFFTNMNGFYAIVTVIGFLLGVERTAAFRSGCVGNYCFVISEYTSGEILNQTAAQQWCRNNRCQLAEIVSQDVQDAVQTFVRSLPNKTDSWYIRTNGIRSPSRYWGRLSNISMGSITVLEEGYGEFYAYLWSSGTRFDVYAARTTDTSRTGYVCTDESDCSDGMRIANGQCYRSHTVPTGLSWYDARNQCLTRGGDLASFDYITSNDGFNNLSTSWLSTSYNYWIGIRRESWTWQDSNLDMKYSNWQQGQPGTDDNCVTLYGGNSNNPPFQWWPHRCDDATPFLCLSGPSTTTTISSSSTVVSLNATPGFSERSTPGNALTVPGSSTQRSKESAELSSGLRQEAKIGIGVGVGVGGFLLIVVVVIVVIILNKYFKRTQNKKQSLRETQHQNEETMIAMGSGGGAEEGKTVYAEVLRSPEANQSTASNKQQELPTVYQELDIAKNDS